MAGRLTNWAGNLVFSASEVVRPGSVGELAGVVGRERSVRVLGSGHSFNDVADSEGVLVSVAGLPEVVDVDSAAGVVKVAAGMRYAEVARRLDEKGLSLHNMASLPHISVAGSVATGTHGSGDGNGSLATAVVEVEMVTAEGDVVTIRRGEHEAFDGAVVALGALGVVTSLTLEVGPSFQVRQQVFEGLPFEALDDHFDAIMSGAYSVSLFTQWHGDTVGQIWMKRRDGDPDVPEDGVFGAAPATEPRHPIPGVSAEHCTQQLGVPGPWHERLPHFRPGFTPSAGEELQTEFLLPRSRILPALHALRAIQDRIAPVLQISEIRTMTADDLWLSPSQGRDTVGVHFTWIKDTEAVIPVVSLIDDHLGPYDARPHWGKVFTTSAETLRSRYEHWDDFHGLMRHHDPSGKFANAYIRRLFGKD
ncbi:D-arabinono-1,4-lactone oxidase [Sphaerisporangium rubeum]|uniref:Xylitol oxidase n=1 Tax=Sphaerisporangium rubeum TaxID=321317 RepID=A0A7X0M594_9ACTN|nr:xylitol oxidase [Sphaerisporangium rubeum]